MHKLTVEVDMDLNGDQIEASGIIGHLIEEMGKLKILAEENKLAPWADGVVISPLEDDELAGNWRIDPK